MKVGIILPQFDAGPSELLGAARLAEESGLDSVWVFDNLWGVPDRRRPVLESWTSLAAAAAATADVTVGTLISRTTLRNRRVLLSMAETVEMIAPGRLVVGLGVGDSRTAQEQRAYGFGFLPLAERVQELERHLDLFNHAGAQFPVWIGGGNRHIMSLLPKAAGWNYWGSVDAFARRLTRARGFAGDRSIPLSWGGAKVTADELDRLASLGASHAIVAAGSHNFREKIQMLSAWRSAQPTL